MALADPTERIADVRDDVDRIAQTFERARDRQTTVSGADRTRQVSVRVSPSGEVEDILLGNRWSQEVAPEDLGAALVEAYTQATTASINQWGEAVADEAEAPAPQARPMTTRPTSMQLRDLVTPERLADQSENALAAMAFLLEGVLHDYEQVSSDVTALVARRIEAHSQGATVTLDGNGVLIGVAVDADWAEATAPGNLSRHVMTAYRQARREARSRTVDDVIHDSRLGRLQRLAEEPEALAAELGLL
ncbi:MAG: hypothetical protein M3237_00475 [Actinomycetota bacterium]|nr:hypothetical protein [Actinomycetota bacterium]